MEQETFWATFARPKWPSSFGMSFCLTQSPTLPIQRHSAGFTQRLEAKMARAGRDWSWSCVVLMLMADIVWQVMAPGLYHLSQDLSRHLFSLKRSLKSQVLCRCWRPTGLGLGLSIFSEIGSRGPGIDGTFHELQKASKGF